MEGHSGIVMSVCFSPDGRLLASGSEDKSIRWWDVQLGIQVAELEKGKGYQELPAVKGEGDKEKGKGYQELPAVKGKGAVKRRAP